MSNGPSVDCLLRYHWYHGSGNRYQVAQKNLMNPYFNVFLSILIFKRKSLKPQHNIVLLILRKPLRQDQPEVFSCFCFKMRVDFHISWAEPILTIFYQFVQSDLTGVPLKDQKLLHSIKYCLLPLKWPIRMVSPIRKRAINQHFNKFFMSQICPNLHNQEYSTLKIGKWPILFYWRWLWERITMFVHHRLVIMQSNRI